MSNKHDSPAKMGLTMMILAWGVLFILLGVFFNDWLNKQNNPNQKPLSTNNAGRIEVVLQPNRQHHYVVNGSINKHPTVFLLDTGATDVVIPEQLAKKIGLRRGSKQRATTANGTVNVYRTMLQNVQIGEISLNNIEASINPSMEQPVVLLGMSALKKVEFTQKGEMLILRQ